MNCVLLYNDFGPGSSKEQEEILCMNATAGTHSALPSDYEVQNAKYVLFVHRALKSSSSSNLQPLFDQLV